RCRSPAARESATPGAGLGLPATRTAAGHSTTPPWVTPGAVLALWEQDLLLGALLGPQCRADSAAHTFRPAAQNQHLLLPELIGYHTWEDLPFTFTCGFLEVSSLILLLTTPLPLFSGFYAARVATPSHQHEMRRSVASCLGD